MSRREGVLLSVVVHGTVLLLVLLLPQIPFIQDLLPEPEEVQTPARERREPDPTFVFVQPPVETPPPEAPPEVAELSDRDREARDPDVAALPENPLPFALGNTSERIVEVPDEETAAGEQPDEAGDEPESTLARAEPLGDTGPAIAPGLERPAPQEGLLGEALRNLQRYVQGQTFNNPQGGADEPGADIQFDSRGVDFGPWLRRFVQTVYRNWFVPQSALVLRGQVVLQFNVHKNGRITDIVVARPSEIQGFTQAAYNAIYTSSPLDPLPEEYPLDPAQFTVTFYYGAPDR